jgi:membrane protein implicated in regulation of membrane protease activity
MNARFSDKPLIWTALFLVGICWVIISPLAYIKWWLPAVVGVTLAVLSEILLRKSLKKIKSTFDKIQKG